MAYMRSSWMSHDGRFRIEKRYFSHRAVPSSPEVREQRARKQNMTRAAQAEVNRRLRAEKLSRLLLDNFTSGDWYFTLTLAEVMDAAALQEAFAQFKRRVRAIYRKAGVPARYISVLENLSGGGRPHGHILLPALRKAELEEIKALWPHGNVEVKLYGGHVRDAERLADYFTKEKIAARSGRIQPSRNLIRTEPKRARVSRSEVFKREIAAPKGYCLLKDLSYSTFTAEGYPLVIAFFERMPEVRGYG